MADLFQHLFIPMGSDIGSTDIRQARPEDEDALYRLEVASFPGDRLSRRRIRHWLHADNRVFLVAERDNQVIAYCLVLLHKGTRLARLYSIAIAASARGQGLARTLLETAENHASDQGRLFMRLEVAQNNSAAIALYQRMGYQQFGTFSDYYEDHQDALRMQKRIRYLPRKLLRHDTPWYCQTTDFSCGPASLMMAMAGLDPEYQPSQIDELNLWREATTIFMTSGHGGCHPAGLALAAQKRGFRVRVYVSQRGPLFLEGVRSPDKKKVLEVVERHYIDEATAAGIDFHYGEVTQADIEAQLNRGGAVIILISLYRMMGTKEPHWVTVTGMDEQCIYLHDPDCQDPARATIDCQHIPIARDDFGKMASFGRQRLRTALFLDKV